MRSYLKRSICFLLAVMMTLSLSACSAGTRMTEENITKTIQKVEKALREFDTQTLEKYVSSKTLDYIIRYAAEHEQINRVGKLLFKNLEINIKSVDTKNATASVEVKNKDLALGGERYMRLLNTRSRGDTFKMLELMSDEDFLNLSEKMLTAQISRATVPDNPTAVTLKIKKGKGNLIVSFDEKAEDAVAGGAVKSIKNAYKEKLSFSTTKNN